MTRAVAPVTALPAGHPSLKARLADAIAALIGRESNREVGRWIGRKGQVVPERADDVDAWPLSELRILADHDRDVDAALRAYVCGEQVRVGEPVAAIGALIANAQASSTLVAQVLEDIRDGRIDHASDLLLGFHARRREEDETVIPALRACVQETVR